MADWPSTFPRGVVRGHGEPGPGGVDRDGRLEAAVLLGTDLAQPAGAGAREHRPAVEFSRPVPARVDGGSARRIDLGHDRGFVGRVAGPVRGEGPVRLIPDRELAVQDQRPVLREFREVRQVAPPDQHPAVGQHLHAALVGGEQARRVGVTGLQRRLHGGGVQVQQDGSRLGFLRRRRAVVEDAQDAGAVRADVVLPPEGGARPHLEARPLPAEPPGHLPARAGYLVDGTGIAGRDQELAVRRDRDRVDVEVVERVRLGAAGERLVGVGDRDVVQAVPLEQHAAGRDVDLLHGPGQGHPLLRPAQLGQVGRHRPERGDQRGVLRGDDELVQVGLQSVARADGGDGPVRTVGDHRLAFPVAGDHAALPPGEHRLAPVGLDLEVHPSRPGAGREGGVRRIPDDAAVPVQDHQSRLARPGKRIARGRQDEVGGVGGRRGGLTVTVRDRQGRGVEIAAGHEVQHPAGVLRRRRGRGAVRRQGAATRTRPGRPGSARLRRRPRSRRPRALAAGSGSSGRERAPSCLRVLINMTYSKVAPSRRRRRRSQRPLIPPASRTGLIPASCN